MSQQSLPVNINNFVKGFITEASPLTFPDNASLDEQNFVLNRNGSRSRRLGIELSSSNLTTSTSVPSTGITNFNQYLWKNVANIADKTFCVIQVGSRLYIYDSADLTQAAKSTFTFEDGVVFGITSVDGFLVVVDGTRLIKVLSYNSVTDAITLTTDYLKIRDLFGVDDGLLTSDTLDTRPTTLSKLHTYNLYNQTFAYPRYNGNSEVSTDPIFCVFDKGGVYPANSDYVTPYVFANANDGDDRTSLRFFAKSLVANPLGNQRAPVGYFIIDAMLRGASRQAAVNELRAKFSELQYDVSGLPADYTEGGAMCVEQYSGRIFYSGFNGESYETDSQSPSMQSYVLFSKLISNKSDFTTCYQVGDPTSSDNSDILDTDGGFVRIDGAIGIKRLVGLGSSLVILADNGVWQLTGGSDYGFTATQYKLTKLSDRGCTSSTSVVVIDNSILFFGYDGIYSVAKNQFGDYVVENTTINSIQTYYNELDDLKKRNAFGFFDGYERKVHWVIKNDISESVDTEELVLDLTLGAYYRNLIYYGNYLIGAMKTPEFSIDSGTIGVVNSDEVVVVDDEVVGYASGDIKKSYKEFFYVTLTSIAASSTSTSTANVRIAQFTNTSFLDWGTTDAYAYLVTGYLSGGDFMRRKFNPYIVMYFNRTETGWDTEYNLVGQSSCKVQAQWSWTNSANGGKWGTAQEAYRLARPWLPSSTSDEYDDGQLVISTRTKLRGCGKVLSLKIYSSEGKDLQLLGWSMIINVNGTL